MRTMTLSLLSAAWISCRLAVPAVGLEPMGIVYESEAVSSPKDAWIQDKRTSDHWMLWTKEQDIEKKRSGKAVLASPTVPADRQSPEQGAPPLHSVVTDLEPGLYLVYASSPGGRPLAYSLDGKEWFRHVGREVALGPREITNGRFELWVDDRYAHPPGNPGPGYYDYIRFVPVPASAGNVRRYAPFVGLADWVSKEQDGLVVSAEQITDLSGFALHRGYLRASKKGSRFAYTVKQAGTYYLAVEMNDDVDGLELLVCAHNGKEVACIVGDLPRDGRHLYSVTTALELAEGDTLTFTCRTDVGFYRVFNLYLAAKPIVPPPPRFADIETWSPEPGTVHLCWTTTSIVDTGVVEYTIDNATRRVPRSSYRGRNHRVVLTGLDPTQEVTARIRTDYEKQRLVSRPITFRATPVKPPPTRPHSVALTVPEPTEHARSAWPVTFGVPFGPTMLAGPSDLSLDLPKATEDALQAECFSRWPDGSVKWATLSFLANTKTSDPPARYIVRAEPRKDTPKTHDLTGVRRSADLVDVRSDSIGFTIDPKTPALLSNVVTRDADADAVDVFLEGSDGKGRPLTAGGPDPDGFAVESNGPVRTVLRWTGALLQGGKPSGWAYRIRLTLCKGQPMLRCNVSVWNDVPSPTFRELGSLALRAKPRNASFRGGIADEALQAITPGKGLALLQDRDNRFVLQTPGAKREGKRFAGSARIATDHFHMTALLRDFWQTYPSGYVVDAEGLHVQLLPPLRPDTYDDPESAKWFGRIYAWFKEGKYLFRAGQLTQHDVVLHLGDPDSSPDAGRLSAWLSMPLLPRPEDGYLCGTDVLGRRLFPQTKGLWDSHEAMFARGFANHLKDRERRRTYGWMHWGDWFGERVLNYGNNEYDLNWAMGVQWMRTGHRAYFQRGLEMARHYTTVDTVHGRPSDRHRALCWTHCFNHVGTAQKVEDLRFPKDDKDAETYLERFRWGLRGGMDPQGHIYQPGNWLYAALTGEQWFRDVAERVCMHQATHLTPRFNFSIERSGGWPLINASMAYAFSGNPYYLNAARLMIERCLQREDPESGGWPHHPPSSETGGKRVLGGKAFAVGILTHGILRYLEQEPRDRPEVRRMLVRGADWLMNEAWVPGKGFKYITNAPNWEDRGSRGMTCLLNAEVIAFAYEQTRDVKYLDFWKTMMAGLMPTMSNGMGKSYTQQTRQTIDGLDRVRHFGLTCEPAAANVAK